MNIKKALALSILIAAGTSVFAQTSNVRKALNSFQEYEKIKNSQGAELLKSNFLNQAKEAIDLAVVHDRTKESPDAWTYYSLIYSNLATDSNDDEHAAKAEEAIKKAQSLDSKEKNKENLDLATQTLYIYNFNRGVAYYGEGEYENAYNAFDRAEDFMPGDTIATINAASAAIKFEEVPQKSIEKYLELIDVKDYSQHKNIMMELPRLYLIAQDTTNSLKYAALAVQEYPDDSDVAMLNIEYNLIAGNVKGIISEIELQIEKNNNNKILYFCLGLAHNSNGELDKAYEAYQNALKIDPNYTDANLNAGVVLINITHGELQTLNKQENLTNAQYEEKLNTLKEGIKPAEEHLLLAVENEPKNVQALSALKSLYDFLQLTEKSAAIQAQLEEI